MKTAMQELIEWCNSCLTDLTLSDGAKIALDVTIVRATDLLEKEKEQIQKAFSDGQETPINHPTLPHYSRDEYYDDNYNS